MTLLEFLGWALLFSWIAFGAPAVGRFLEDVFA